MVTATLEGISLFYGILIFAYLYVAVNIQRSLPLKIAFMVFPLFLAISGSWAISLTLAGEPDSAINRIMNATFLGNVFFMVLVLAYFFITFMTDQLKQLTKRRVKRGEK